MDEHKPRWTPNLQRAADDIRAEAYRVSEVYDLSMNEVIIALVMAAATLTPSPNSR